MRKGKVIWRVDNSHVATVALPIRAEVSACPTATPSSAVTPSANAGKVRVFEVNREKEVVWELFHPDSNAHGIHVISTNSKPLSDASLK